MWPAHGLDRAMFLDAALMLRGRPVTQLLATWTDLLPRLPNTVWGDMLRAMHPEEQAHQPACTAEQLAQGMWDALTAALLVSQLDGRRVVAPWIQIHWGKAVCKKCAACSVSSREWSMTSVEPVLQARAAPFASQTTFSLWHDSQAMPGCHAQDRRARMSYRGGGFDGHCNQ